MRSQLACHQTGQAHHSTLGGRIGRHKNPALEAEHRRRIDDFAAPPLFDHDSRCRLAEEKEGSKIDIHHIVPVFLRKLQQRCPPDNAGIVKKDVNAAQFFDRFFDNHIHAILFAQVCCNGNAFTTEFFDAGLALRHIENIHQGQIRPCFRQGNSNGPSEAAGRTGYDCLLTVQLEFVQNHIHLPYRI